MRLALVVVVASVVLGGCTSKDELFCTSNTECNNGYVCDVDGTLGGTANTCVSETGDGGVTKPDGGEDTDGSVPQACPATAPVSYGNGLCGGCQSTADCSGDDKCDVWTGECRACAEHSDCPDSGVCDRRTGECVPEAQIAYADLARATGTCNRDDPCPLPVALAGNQPWIRVVSASPGIILLTVPATSVNPRSLGIVGGSGNPADVTLSVSTGTALLPYDVDLVVDSLTVTTDDATGHALHCEGAAAGARVHVFNSVLRASNVESANETVAVRSGCELNLIGSRITDSDTAISGNTGSTMNLVGSHLDGNRVGVSCGSAGATELNVTRTTFTNKSSGGYLYAGCNSNVTSSVFRGHGYTAIDIDGSGTFAFNTFINNGSDASEEVICNADTSVVLDGNVFVAPAFQPVVKSNCNSTNDNAYVMDFPVNVFADPQAGDYTPIIPELLNAYNGNGEPPLDLNLRPRPLGNLAEYGAVETLSP